MAVLSAALAAMPAPLPAQDEPLPERLLRAATDRMAADDVPGAVMVLISGGVPVWTGVVGLADLATGRPMTADALFRVESLSKPVSAWGAMRLAVTGRLDLDAPIAACLNGWQPLDGLPPITARQLLSNTSGIGLGDYQARLAPGQPKPPLAEHLARDFTLIGRPGAGFSYSDTGFNLLELVIESCTGDDFAALIEREVLAPLGMAGAGYGWADGPMPMGYDLHGRPVAPYVYPARASGDLHATAADLVHLAVAGMAGAGQQVLPAAAIAEMQRPVAAVGGLFGFVAEGYGLGHFTETLSDGRTAVWHGGQGYGWMSHMHLVPATGDGMVILANSQRAWPLFAAILREWSNSLGVAPVGMARVLWAQTAARFAIAALLALAPAGLWCAGRGRACSGLLRGGAGGLALLLCLWPLWAVAQDYLFLFAILPGVWPWLAAASGLAGIGLAALALAPQRHRPASGGS